MKSFSFSLKIYLFVVVLLSWPFQIAYLFLGESYRPILLVSMLMAGVATYICSTHIFKDGFKNAGWSFGKPKHYFFSFALPLFLWFIPILLSEGDELFDLNYIRILNILSTFLISFTLTLLPAFAEEFSWRGYLLPRLLKTYSNRKALLIQGFVTWFWHFPFIISMGLEIPGNAFISILTVSIISLIPTIMHAVVFACFWSASKSLAVSSVYHSAFDETRDTLQNSIGFGPFVEIWQMCILSLLGTILLIKTKWLNHKIQSK